jgi:hypothetical protein
MIARIFAACAGVLRGIDDRPVAQVRAEIAEELQDHLERLRAECRETGVPEVEIEQRIVERFGDLSAYARRCERIALKERIMLQKINFGLLILVLGTLAWMIHGTHHSLGHQQELLARLEKQLSVFDQRMPAAASSVQRREAAPVAEKPNTYTVRGKIDRAGEYMLPSIGTLTAFRAAAAAGWTASATDAPTELLVQRINDRMELVTVHRVQLAPKMDKAQDFAIAAGDIIELR